MSANNLPFSLKVGDSLVDLSYPRVMGILNVTPDSFSDGGQLYGAVDSSNKVNVTAALRSAEQMCQDGAAILDIGGESTRPGAQKVGEQEELDRVLPVVEAIAGRLNVGISVDTSTPRVMREALALGAGLINDVRALSREGSVPLLADNDAAICLMHMQGQPSTMQEAISYDSVVDEVYAYLSERVKVCVEAGIERSRLIVDPGFGFGKSLAHNYQLLRELRRFQALELPILVGVSRKSMIGGVCGRDVNERLAGTLSATVHALEGGAAIIRAHDVAATIDAIKVHCAVKDIELTGKM